MSTAYFRDENSRVWSRKDFQGISYSDGVEAERRIYEIIKAAEDTSVFSNELFMSTTDWPSEYHLSRSRHCLLRPLKIRPGEKVLELGCGCGAITRYLGEIGACVTAVEGGQMRSMIAAERCRDLPNVHVYMDDLLSFESSEAFDWVFLVGVLEYSSLYSDEKNPVQHYLARVGENLASNGKLVLAIENKLGLKYFNGCSEDHVGTPFFGLQDLYSNHTPVTFGRRELSDALSEAGFGRISFYYPFPDYKLPSVIIHESAFNFDSFNIPDLLLRAPARDYTGSPYRLFNEALVYRSLHQNGLMEAFSNSFLVVATKEKCDLNCGPEIAWSFAVQRTPGFATETVFYLEGNEIRVQKKRIMESEPEQGFTFGNNMVTLDPQSSDYVCGNLLLLDFVRASHAGCSTEEVAKSLLPWLALLLMKSNIQTVSGCSNDIHSINLSELSVDGAMIDCAPFNLIENCDGLKPIDREWKVDGELPLGFVLTRGVLGSVFCSFTSSISASVVEILTSLCRLRNIYVNSDDVLGWLNADQNFQKLVTGNESFGSDLSGFTYLNPIDELLIQKQRLLELGIQECRDDDSDRLKDKLCWDEREVQEILETVDDQSDVSMDSIGECDGGIDPLSNEQTRNCNPGSSRSLNILTILVNYLNRLR